VQRMRRKVDIVDDKILKLLLERRDLALEISRLKTEAEDSIGHEERAKQILERIGTEADRMGMDGEEVKHFWKALIKYMISEQTKRDPRY